MNIAVEYKDKAGNISTKQYTLSRLAFAKHFAIAGQRCAPTPRNLLRIIGMFLHYSFYLQGQDFYNNKFSVPPAGLYDPTEKGQFSNLAGKAIADFLSKRIDGSLYTDNYEAVMLLKKMPLNVGRPDLIAYTQNSMFAIEAKGYSRGCGNMTTHKNQSKTGGIPVNFTVACVSYNLYNQVRCKYHDPYNNNIQFDFGTFKELTKKYYSSLAEFLNEQFFFYEEIEINGENFYAVDLNFEKFEKILLTPFLYSKFFYLYRLQLILPSNIRELAKNGLPNDIKPYDYEPSKQENIYIDNDRVGLRIQRYNT